MLPVLPLPLNVEHIPASPVLCRYCSPAGIQQWTGSMMYPFSDFKLTVSLHHPPPQPLDCLFPSSFQPYAHNSCPKQIELEDEVQQLWKLIGWQWREGEITIQRDAAEVHCMLMQHQNALLQQQINSKQSMSTRQIHTTSWILTSEALVSEWKEDKARHVAGCKRRQTKKAEKAKIKWLQLSNCAMGTKVFSGSLTSRKQEPTLKTLWQLLPFQKMARKTC